MPFRLIGRLRDRSIRLALKPGVNRIGSSADVDLQLDDPTVSHAHAEIEVLADSVEVRDLGSRNGTFVADRRITVERVGAGTTLAFGQVRLQVDTVTEGDLVPASPLAHDTKETRADGASELSTVRTKPAQEQLRVDARPLLAHADADLTLYLDKIRHCLGLLDDTEVWWRANARSNSIGNLVLHLCGNLSQWVLEGLGGRPYERHRAEEFSADGGLSRAELLAKLATVVDECRQVIAALGETELAAPRTIQGYSTDGLRALLHVWEHMSYHTGQIVLLTKQLVGDRSEIEFYPQHRAE